MKLALIITSRGRQEFVDRFFASLAEQWPLVGKVVVVDQGGRLILPSRTDGIIHVVTGMLGLSAARNIGLRYCGDSDIIGFPDDDCWYPSDLLGNVINEFSLDAELACLCSRVYDPIRGRSYGRRPANVVRRISGADVFMLPISVGIFVRNPVLRQVGGSFNEGLGAGTSLGSGEETELVARILMASKKVIYNGNLEVYHELDDPSLLPLRKVEIYGYGCGYLHAELVMAGLSGSFYSFLLFIIRSFAGAVWLTHSVAARRIYRARAAGLLAGYSDRCSKCVGEATIV